MPSIREVLENRFDIVKDEHPPIADLEEQARVRNIYDLLRS